MYITIYNVVVNDNVVSCGLRSRSDAELVRQQWIKVFPCLDVRIYSEQIPITGGDLIV